METILFVIQMSRVEAKEERQRAKEERRNRPHSQREEEGRDVSSMRSSARQGSEGVSEDTDEGSSVGRRSNAGEIEELLPSEIVDKSSSIRRRPVKA